MSEVVNGTDPMGYHSKSSKAEASSQTYHSHMVPQTHASPATGRPIQSVVTHSFSVEDDRDDELRQRGYHQYANMPYDPRYYRPDVGGVPAHPQTTSHHHLMQYALPPYPIQHSFSSGMSPYYAYPQLKRNYFHHTGHPTQERPLPSEFIPPNTPPKRAKLSHRSVSESNARIIPDGSERNKSEGEIAILPKTEEMKPAQVGRSSTWSAGTGASFALRQPQEERELPEEDKIPVSCNRMNLMSVAAEQVAAQNIDGESSMTLLSLPEDSYSLNETLCIVRQNIEIFTATQKDVNAPAPGRKHNISVGQVGLRCIHCRHNSRPADRVKRAVCYPSSVKRVYRTVIDMKLDHFPLCRFVPNEIKIRLNELKSFNTRSSGTTMTYFIKGAEKLGMRDSPDGVGVCLEKGVKLATSDVPQPLVMPAKKMIKQASPPTEHPNHEEMLSEEFFVGKLPLALPEDADMLSPLRCFLRKHIVVFSTTKDEIEQRVPGSTPIYSGSVGIGCRYCMECPVFKRSVRASCYPFTVGRIYQAVADIQRFHFPKCENIPKDVIEEYQSLASAIGKKGSRKFAVRRYWVSSAYKLGLGDTPQGIRFIRDPTKQQPESGFSLDILAQAAYSLTDDSSPKKLVLPEDRESIPASIHFVMDQLQAYGGDEAEKRMLACCKHCGVKKFDWESPIEIENDFNSIHHHLTSCMEVPEEIKKQLLEPEMGSLEVHFDDAAKVFFKRFFERLQDDLGSNMSTDAEMDDRDDVEMASV